MKRLMFGFTALFILAVTGCGGNADKIIGTWQVVKFKGKEAPKGIESTVEFTKDGKVIAIDTDGGKEVGKNESTYKVEGDKIKTTKKKDGKDEESEITIKSISGDMMVLVKDGDEMELKKK